MKQSFWDAVCVVLAVVDIALCLWPLVIICRLQIPLRRKALAYGCFACRMR